VLSVLCFKYVHFCTSIAFNIYRAPTSAPFRLSMQEKVFTCATTEAVTAFVTFADESASSSSSQLVWRVDGQSVSQTALESGLGQFSLTLSLDIGTHVIGVKTEEDASFTELTVQIAEFDLPQISITTNKNEYFRNDREPISLNAIVTTACRRELNKEEFLYEWKITDEAGQVVPGITFDNLNFSPNFRASRFTTTGANYNIKVVCKSKSDATKTSSADATIRIGSRPPVIRINGHAVEGDTLKFRASKSDVFQLDASHSSHSDAYDVDSYSFEWTCEKEYGAACGMVSVGNNAEVLEKSPNVGMYYFQLTFTSTYNEQKYAVSIRIEVDVVDGDVPDFEMYMQVAGKDATFDSERVVQPYDSVSLYAIPNVRGFTCADGSQAENTITYNWTVYPSVEFNNGGDLLTFDATTFANRGNEVFKVWLNASACKDSRFESQPFSFRVNKLPTGGKCEVTPLWGFYVDTTFTLECSNWYSMSPLSYNYEYADPKDQTRLHQSPFDTMKGDEIVIKNPPKGFIAVRAIIKDDKGGVVKFPPPAYPALNFEVKKNPRDPSCPLVRKILELQQKVKSHSSNDDFFELVKFAVRELSDRGDAFTVLNRDTTQGCGITGLYSIADFRRNITQEIILYVNQTLSHPVGQINTRTAKEMMDALHYLARSLSSLFSVEGNNCLSQENGARCLDECQLKDGKKTCRVKRVRKGELRHECKCVMKSRTSEEMELLSSVLDHIMKLITAKRESVLFQSTFSLVYQKLGSYCGRGVWTNYKELPVLCEERRVYEGIANQLISTATDKVMLGGYKTYDSDQGTATIYIDDPNSHFRFNRSSVKISPEFSKWKMWKAVHIASSFGVKDETRSQIMAAIRKGDDFSNAFNELIVTKLHCLSQCSTHSNKLTVASAPMEITLRICQGAGRAYNHNDEAFGKVCIQPEETNQGRRLLAKENMVSFNLDVLPEFADEAKQRGVPLHEMYLCAGKQIRFSDTYEEYFSSEGEYVLEGCTTTKTVSEGGGGAYGTIECSCDSPNREFVAVQSPKYDGSNEGGSKDSEEDTTLSKAASTFTSLSVAPLVMLGYILKI
jgi:hypothetical protein